MSTPLPPIRNTPLARPLRAMLPGLLLISLAACEDDPFAINWQPAVEVAFLYSLDRPEQNLPTGFDFHNRQVIDITAAGQGLNWDVAVATREGQLVFLPPGAVGIESEARIAVISDTALNDVITAPTDLGAYVTDQPVPLRVGDVYVVRSRLQRDFFGIPCVYYAKATPLEVSVETGFLRLQFDTNPLCNDSRLRPPG